MDKIFSASMDVIDFIVVTLDLDLQASMTSFWMLWAWMVFAWTLLTWMLLAWKSLAWICRLGDGGLDVVSFNDVGLDVVASMT